MRPVLPADTGPPAPVPGFEPVPGTLPICATCQHRQGIVCERSKIHGGPGVVFGPPPTQVHLCIRGPHKGQSGWRSFFAAIETCNQKQEFGDGHHS